MRFFQSFAIAALSVIASCVSAQSNPITFPGTSDVVSAGTSVTIKWNPTSSGTVTLQLRYGDSKNLAAGPPIVVKVPNQGQYSWDVPTTIGSGSWSIEIKDSSNNINYSPMFQITGGTGKQGATGITKTKTFSSTPATATPSSSSKTGSSSAGATTGASSASGSPSAPSAGAAVSNVVGGLLAAAFGLGGALAVMA